MQNQLASRHILRKHNETITCRDNFQIKHLLFKLAIGIHLWEVTPSRIYILENVALKSY